MRRLRRIGRTVLFAGLCIALVGPAANSAAEPLDPADVPAPLAPWVDWALRGHEAERCSLLTGFAGKSRVCAWPTRLALDLGETRGTFAQSWNVERTLRVPLPGDQRHWPQAVQVDGANVPVVAVSGRPHVELQPGNHAVTGRFGWDSLPELIQIPRGTALLALTLRSSAGAREVPLPKRDNQGRLWLRQRGETGEGQESRLDVLVHRRVIDDVPMQLDTRIDLEVSGRSREVVLGKALPAGFVPMSLDSPLPARLDAGGQLRVQVRPGRFGIRLRARRTARGAELALADPNGPWAPSEVWVFEARPALRIVTVTGKNPVDPQQTRLPEAWKNLPAWLLKPGDALEIAEKRRGDAEPAPDALGMTRRLWLDFDGRGYTVQDRIRGEIRRSSRLDMSGSTTLGRVELNGRDQFITTRPGNVAFEGIEVPRGAISLVADSRVDRSGVRLPAVGWDQDFQSVSAQLQLPPGWRLLHAAGVDRADSTWLNRWNLLDLFTALIIVLAFGRLWGIAWGALAGFGMLLTYTEPGAPQWAWIAVLVGEALARAIASADAATRWRRFAGWISMYRAAALLALLLAGVPFAIEQARIGLHPALETRPPSVRPALEQELPRAAKVARSPAESIEEDVVQSLELKRGRMQAPRRSSGVLSESEGYQPDPGAKITTGPGLPDWAWRQVDLSWNGPVTRDHELQLVLLPPWINAIVCFLRVGLFAALVACVVLFGTAGRGWIPISLLSSRSAGVFLALLGGASVWLVSPTARAEFPSDPLIDELRSRLLEAPECAPACALAPRLELAIRAERLELSFQVDASAEIGAPLPSGGRSWLPDRVTVDGAAAPGLRAANDGVLWVRLAPGVHQVELSGPLPQRDSFELALPLRPQRVDADLPGWTLNGLVEDGRPEGTLQLTRVVKTEPSEAASRELEAQELPAFVEVVRRIRLGLTWQVHTVVRRLTPIEPALRLDLPLLPGEAVTTAGIRSAAGRAQVALDPGIRQVQWQSTLANAAELVLLSEEGAPFREVWHLDVNPIWHVDFAGIPVVHQPSAAAARVRQWRPWPGERVTLQISRPEGVEGRTATIDATTLAVVPGGRATDSTLTVALRSSRGGEHSFELPEGSELQSVAINGVVQPVRQEGTRVTITLVPGKREVTLVWREPRGVELRTLTPRVDLGMESVNASLQFAVPHDRWVLLTGGPRLGPSVLFWSFVAVLVVIALALGRIPFTPLRFYHWLLLGLGLTQVPIEAAAIVVVWLLALGARGDLGLLIPGRWFDLAQIGLVFLTVFALTALVVSIQGGLLGLPEMQVSGNGSSGFDLRWYEDRTGQLLPTAWVISVPVLYYRIAMLIWALWLAQALLGWLRWGWGCFTRGEVWRPLRPRTPNVEA